MNIEIRGVNFVNKGAELMLHAVVQALQQRSGLDAMAVSMGIGHADRVAALRLHRTLSVRRLGRFRNLPARLIPHSVRRLQSWITESELGAVLDASGFLYSDQWGPEGSVDAARLYRNLARRGQKVVLLPQAFGPFKSRAIAKAVKSVVKSSQLVYARDRVSYQHLRDLCGDSPVLRQAPDFTNLVQSEPPRDLDRIRGKACVIPNYRMVDKTDRATAAAYVGFLAGCVDALRKRGIESFVLIHETEEDQRLVRDLTTRLGRPLPIVEEKSALTIKGVIEHSLVVIGSRYHGIVSALSQNVPCIATGWSHKYQLLFEEYHLDGWLVAPEAGVEAAEQLLDSMVTEPGRSQCIEQLRAVNQERKAAVRSMWTEVCSVLQLGS